MRLTPSRATEEVRSQCRSLPGASVAGMSEIAVAERPPTPPAALTPDTGTGASVSVAPVSERRAVDELFAEARAGSASAWAELYALLRPRLFRYARLRLATDEQAEDAVSETMVRAIASAHRYTAGTGPAAWMVGICRNVVFEAYRAGGRQRSVDPELMARDAGPAPEPGPAEQLIIQAEQTGLRQAFERLGADDRDLLALRVVAGLATEEVAATLGKRAGAVRMAQSRALDRLRGLMDDDR